MTTTTNDLDHARAWAQELAESHPSVHAVYLTGSRAQGKPRSDSDYDLVVVVDDASELQIESSGWIIPGSGSTYLPVSLNADVCFLRLDEFTPDDVAFFTRGMPLVWERRLLGGEDSSRVESSTDLSESELT